MSPNEAGGFLIEGPNLELGIWHGTYQNMTTTWLRVWDSATGEIIQTYEERIDAARDRIQIDKERTRLAEIATQQAKKIAELAVELDRLNKQIDYERKRAEHYS